jgi:polyisoprenoid-binding protein YceI
VLRKSFAIVLTFFLLTFVPASSATEYSIDAAHSNIGFSIPILGGISEVQGKFTDFTVTINYDEADVTKSSVHAVIKAASIDTGIERRDNHLRNADFFDVEKFPEITFKSSKVVKKGKQLMAHGTFTMHGVSKEIVLPITMTGQFVNPETKKTTYGFSSTVKINRMDYGINYQSKGNENFLGKIVEIKLTLLTKPPAEPK